MNKSCTIVRIAGALLALFSVLIVAWSYYFGVLGARTVSVMDQPVLMGLFMFYGLYGAMNGIFLIAVASVCLRHANAADKWRRFTVWGIVLLVIGVINFLTVLACCRAMEPGSSLFPHWYSFGTVITGGIVLPLFTILSGLLSRRSSAVPES